ncbi:MAG: aminomethyltransferase family protein, partial [Alphaproteobacteria bacterium]
VTSAFGVLSLMGPKARQILEAAAEGDVGAEAFPFMAAREIQIGGAPVRAMRLTYVGELGWELHVPTEYMLTVYETLTSAGAAFGLVDAGYRAIDSLRLEKGYRAWAADIGPDHTPLEAGLGFAVAFDKDSDFIGRDALLRQREAPRVKRLVTFTADDDPDLLLTGRETIIRDGERVGWLTSGGFGHTIGKHVGMGYVRHSEGVTADYLQAGEYRLEAANRLVDAELHLRPLFDPDSSRVRS